MCLILCIIVFKLSDQMHFIGSSTVLAILELAYWKPLLIDINTTAGKCLCQFIF